MGVHGLAAGLLQQGGALAAGQQPAVQQLGGSLLPYTFHVVRGASVGLASGLSEREEVGPIWADFMRINPLHYGPKLKT